MKQSNTACGLQPALRDGLDADVRKLMRMFPERTWRTPFSVFRPLNASRNRKVLQRSVIPGHTVNLCIALSASSTVHCSTRCAIALISPDPCRLGLDGPGPTARTIGLG